jgi:ATP-binding cassette subfamily F protein 3
LLKLIKGEMDPDEGRLIRSSDLAAATVSQIPEIDLGNTVYSEALTSVAEKVAGEYDRLRTYFETQGGYDYEARTERVLFGLGFSAPELKVPCRNLSGGQLSRLALGMALLQPSTILLLDEPTNHLDLSGRLWLMDYLRDLGRAFIVISHDRYFLNTVTNCTWEIEEKTLYEYRVPFGASRRLRDEHLRRRQAEYERQQEWKRRTEDFIRRNIAGQKTRQAQSRRKKLKRTEWVASPEASSNSLKLEIKEAARGGALAFEVESGMVGYEDQILLRGVDLALYRGQRIGILGGNGVGKTTLIKTLLGQLPLLEGHLSCSDLNSVGYFRQEAACGPPESTVFHVLSELAPGLTDGEIRDFAALFLFQKDDVFKTVEQLSGGERSRLAMARLFFSPVNVLILDEPTNHLDIDSQEVLEKALKQYRGTLILVSHDLYFLEQAVDRFFLIRDQRLVPLSALSELRAEMDLSKTRANSKESVPAPRKKTSKGLSKNEQMRLRARLGLVESRIESRETRKSEVESLLNQGGEDYVHLNQLSTEHQKLEAELVELMSEWEELAGKLEAGTAQTT